MQDLTYFLNLAFSGADLTRALWFGLIGSLLCSSRTSPLRMWILVFLLDRIWPFIMMAFAGYGADEIGAAVSHAIRSIPRDALALILRGVGLYVLIAGGYMIRLLIHGHKPTTKPGKLNVPY